MFRLFAFVASSFFTACGAIMATQAVYDAENASASFIALSAMLFALGVYGGAHLVKNKE